MGVKRWHGPARKIGKSRRWPALRLAALRRDGWARKACGSKLHLQVDYVQPVRDAPEKAFDLDNLQVLCRPCHYAKTRKELGHPELSPERKKWRAMVQEMHRNLASE